MLVNATQNALLFTVDKGFGGEVVDAIIETTLYHFGVHLSKENRLSVRKQIIPWTASRSDFTGIDAHRGHGNLL